MEAGPFILAVALGCATPSNGASNPVGFWESTSTSRGGIGHTLEFKPDGSYVSAVTVIVDQTYRLENGKLFIGDSPADKNQGVAVGIEGDVLSLPDPDGTIVRKERIGRAESKAAPIIGVWRYRHYTGAIAFERYTANGQFLFRLPMASQQGCYVLKDGDLTLVGADTMKGKLRYRVQGDELQISDEGKDPKRYRRAGPWYPRDNIDYRPPPENRRK